MRVFRMQASLHHRPRTATFLKYGYHLEEELELYCPIATLLPLLILEFQYIVPSYWDIADAAPLCT